MDPNAALQDVIYWLDEEGDIEEAIDAMYRLEAWLEKGGFAPADAQLYNATKKRIDVVTQRLMRDPDPYAGREPDGWHPGGEPYYDDCKCSDPYCPCTGQKWR